MATPYRVLIIGGGASGALVARALRARMESGRLLLIERSSTLGQGIAYSSPDDLDLLNVPAARMSGVAEDPNNFLRWVEERQGAADPAAFYPRRWYGQYLADGLRQTGGPALEVHQGEATEVHREADRLMVRTQDGQAFATEHVVVATGYTGARLPIAHEPKIDNPWDFAALRTAMEIHQEVTLLGTGLTMMDTALRLRSYRPDVRITAFSRRGLVPRPHGPSQPRLPVSDLEAPNLRQLVAEVKGAGEDWRSLIDGLRPVTPALWERLSWRTRGQFMRHLRPYWEVLRHRPPPAVHAGVQDMLQSGQLRIGRRAAGSLQGLVVNCTGAGTDYARNPSRLLQSLVQGGLASYDQLGLGLSVDAAGRTSEATVWTLGPLCRGCRLETTAVPEIRVQAARIAEEITAVRR